MIRVIRICRKCGAKIFSDAPEGLCAKCVLKTALTIPPDSPVAAGDLSAVAAYSAEAAAKAGSAKVDGGGSAEDVEVNVAAIAHDDKKAARAVELLGELGDYELLEEVGRGGQGVVFRARQKSLNRTVALKVISLGQWASKVHLRRFRLEAEAAAKLEHPGIVPIHEVGERDGSCYFSMKFVEGGQLDEVVKREPVPIRRAVELIAKVARTVHYAHEHGILHRDIKPGNILLDAKGEPHLTDFGLARLVESESSVTHTLEVLGTPSYMAPEQAVGNNAAVSSVTDVYGLGAVLYQLLTDHPPFAGGTTYETIKLVLDTEPREPRAWNPKIDRDLSTICLKCLDKDPKRRYPSALALAEDLEHWLKHEPIRARRAGVFTRARKWVRRNPSMAAMMALLLALTVPLGVLIWKSETGQLPTSNLVAPEKSIAVLPFSNLSKEPENAFFADGVQDEILTDLARIADLKVISRTSVMHYKSSTARNMREIGRQLGVANVLEGSVQRSGKQVRVNAQLVDARTDRHLWGETYDRDISDVFAIQSEIAKSIADQLQAKLSPNEKNAIERAPTTDVAAFDLYTRAKNILLQVSEAKVEHQQAVDLLNKAIARDPSFFDAYCQLAFAHDAIYFFGYDRTPARLASAEAAIQAAARLRPDAGETHLARARNLYWGYLDYDGALAELEIARRTLPNDPEVFEVKGWIERRRGRCEEATRNLEHAIDLDPHNVHRLLETAQHYAYLRRYVEAEALLDRVLVLAPDNVDAKLARGAMEADSKADLRPALQIVDSIRATNPAALSSIADYWLWVALAQRDVVAAEDALTAAGDNPIQLTDVILFKRPFFEGVVARMTKDDAKARSAFTAARAEQEKIVQAQPNYAPALCVLGLIDAGLGRREDALREGRRAVELLPVENDALGGAYMITYFGLIAAWVGDKDLAYEQLATAVHLPGSGGSLSYGELKLNPWWDPLRDDPRFEKILEEAKQPVAIEATTSGAPEQSIAVLPFENLSDNKDHAFFADGVQDDILTKLAKVGDLKVISRTSVMQYRGKQDVRQIGNTLRVSHVLEGTVRRSGGKVHINAQLVDARSDVGVWAEEYDRDLNDVFAIETEVAQSIGNRLRAKVSAGEKAAIEQRPTKDLVAYDRYVEAAALIDGIYSTSNYEKDLLQAVELLDEAIARDPAFLLAHCRLAEAHDGLYFSTTAKYHTPSRLDLEKAAIDSALRLKPDSGEAHLALATYLYHGYFDYDGARAELAIARRALPNNARIFEWSGYIDRRQSRWHDAARNFERATELDPQNVKILTSARLTYDYMREYARARAIVDRLIAIEPNNIEHRGSRATIDFRERADLRPWHAFDKTMADPNRCPECALALALYERDTVDADHALAALGEGPFRTRLLGGNGNSVELSRAYLEGLVARLKGDAVTVQAAFSAARTQQEEALRAWPDYGPRLCVLALIDAALGRKEEALHEGRRALELAPIARDSLDGSEVLYFYAVICTWTGEYDLAIEQLETLAKIPAGVTYGDLRLNPYWDPLRGDSRFEKIVASLAPK
jgi:TolB-like protein/Tfp pilus assembly protein PilF/tRNA A-37 threonylcarbamoyl transferase component Bud32